jgi:hypothetical protein
MKKKKKKTFVKIEDFKIAICGMELLTKISTTSARFRISQDGPESGDEHGETCKQVGR